MADETRKAEILTALHDGVVEFDEDRTVEVANEAIAEGVDAYEAIMDGLAKGMETVGGMYARQEYFVPELLLCADALYAALEILRPHLKIESHAEPRKIVVGVVEGDIHDIGKNLVKMMFEGSGYRVIDLDINVRAERFLDAYHREKPNLVGLSALLTSTIGEMEKVIHTIREYDPQARFIIGGAPITQEFADRVGADGYAPDAGEAVKVGNRIIGLR